MARGFGSTLGSGTTDRIATAYTGRPSSFTMAAWVYRNGTGGSANGRVWDMNTAVNSARTLQTIDAGVNYAAVIDFATTDGVYRFADPGAGSWVHLCYTHSGSAGAAPTCYVNGASVSVTVSTAGVGAIGTTTGVYYLGNAEASARVWDGSIAEFCIYSTELSASAVAALYKSSPLAVAIGSLVEYVPLVRDTGSRKNATTTVVGTAVQAHPRVLLPAAQIIQFPSAAPASTIPPRYRQRQMQGMAS